MPEPVEDAVFVGFIDPVLVTVALLERVCRVLEEVVTVGTAEAEFVVLCDDVLEAMAVRETVPEWLIQAEALADFVAETDAETVPVFAALRVEEGDGLEERVAVCVCAPVGRAVLVRVTLVESVIVGDVDAVLVRGPLRVGEALAVCVLERPDVLDTV